MSEDSIVAIGESRTVNRFQIPVEDGVCGMDLRLKLHDGQSLVLVAAKTTCVLLGVNSALAYLTFGIGLRPQFEHATVLYSCVCRTRNWEIAQLKLTLHLVDGWVEISVEENAQALKLWSTEGDRSTVFPFSFNRIAEQHLMQGYYLPNGAFLHLAQEKIQMDFTHEVEDDTDVKPAVTATRVWHAALLLLQYIPSANRVLELGAGTGICGLAAAIGNGGPSFGSEHVFLTDLPENCEFLRKQVGCNSQLRDRVSVKALDWTNFDGEDEIFQGLDLVLCSDCVFWPSLLDPLLDVLLYCRSLDTAPRILLSVVERLGRATLFFNRLHERGLTATAMHGEVGIGAPRVYSIT